MKKYIVTIEEVEEQPQPISPQEETRRELDALLDNVYTPPHQKSHKEQHGL